VFNNQSIVLSGIFKSAPIKISALHGDKYFSFMTFFYADEFRSQEIDGQALMLLKEDHLMTTMSMKLGPALKICAKINSLKEGHE
jgi:hypothetical protein